MQDVQRYPCPCCGYLVFEEPTGSYDICPICFWEDDDAQLRFPHEGGGANHVSLVEAQRNVAELGACEAEFVEYVRPLTSDDKRDPSWRPIDASVGNETETMGKDRQHLYYWQENA
jgi:hypothetical protein